MQYPVYNQQGEKVKDVELNSTVFEMPINKELVHQVIVAQEANSRIVLAHTKQRGEVRGGGRKPWRQKGTGRARAGSTRSPIWIGGGVTFGPTSKRNFSKKINKKMKKKALFMALSDKVLDKHLVVLDGLVIEKAKTKKFVELVGDLFIKIGIEKKNSKKEKIDNKENKITKINRKFEHKILIVTPETDEILIRSSKNLKKVKVIRADSLNIKDILNYNLLVILEKSLEIIEKTYL